ncbi:MAG: hypothetical protein NT099_03685 [Candidatus Saganbacteria bacterium]|nr:hypothetical protein [Candidatus Saganbacteria bacterium]
MQNFEAAQNIALKIEEMMKYGVITARRGWLEAKDVLNTFPLKKMMRAIHSS